MTEGIDQQGNRLGGELPDVSALIAAAHELKSPLALIRQLALYSESIDDEQQRAKMLRQIILTSERALRLTTDLTRSVRLEDALFAMEPLNPLTLCEEVARDMSPLYQARGRQIKVHPRSRSVLAIANRDLLRRILCNFVDNALHYSRSEEPVVINASLREGGSFIRLAVRDYGPMIPARTWQDLQRRLGNSAQPLYGRPESSGLGIFIAQQFADAMDAEIGATRHRDGATFYVDIRASAQLRLF